MRRVNGALDFQDGQLKSMDLSDETAELAIVTAARTQLARQRQQLMASLVRMGINRIVVTDGRISAKIMYDFQARDDLKRQRSATAFDYATQSGRVATTWEGEGKHDEGGTYSGQGKNKKEEGDYEYSVDYYSKGDYKYAQKPIVTATSTASEASESALQTRAQLAGNVEGNFKSDYLPLDKMATPGMTSCPRRAIRSNPLRPDKHRHHNKSRRQRLEC